MFPGGRVYYVWRSVKNLLLAVVAYCLVCATDVEAQGHGSGDLFVALRGGTNLVGNTYRFRERKPEPGGGVSAGSFLSPRWAWEAEVWLRASNPECCSPRRREMLYSLSGIRVLADGPVRPYMVGGLTLMRGNASQLQVQVGVGAQFRLIRRFEMALDLRGNGGGSTMIVRPTAALIYNFR